jgi:hypothetical protein
MDNRERGQQFSTAITDQLRYEIESSSYGSIKRFATETGLSYGAFRRYFVERTSEDWREPQISVVWSAVSELGLDADEFFKNAMARVAD